MLKFIFENYILYNGKWLKFVFSFLFMFLHVFMIHKRKKMQMPWMPGVYLTFEIVGGI